MIALAVLPFGFGRDRLVCRREAAEFEAEFAGC
jgi:hypothetical protein